MPAITAKPITATPITARPLTAYGLGESTEGAAAFNPVSLFSSGENGAYFDAATIATLLQDANGVIPVSAVGQPIGLLLDQSQGTNDLGSNLGGEIVSNGGFDTDAGWNKPAGGTISGGAAVFTAVSSTLAFTQDVGFEAGKKYLATFDVTEYTSGGVSLQGSGGDIDDVIRTASGEYQEILTTTSTVVFGLKARGATTLKVDNVSVKLIPGNHASQATSTARPVLSELSGARYVNFDGVDDDLDVILPDLGSDATIALIAADGTVSYQEAQTISGAITLSTDFQKLLYIDRALTAAEKAGWESLA